MNAKRTYGLLFAGARLRFCAPAPEDGGVMQLLDRHWAEKKEGDVTMPPAEIQPLHQT